MMNKNMNSVWPLLGILSCVFLLGACHSIESIERPDINYSENWDNASALDSATPIDKTWWKSFHSPELNRLITQAMQQSPDLRIAAQRVRQAELQMNIAGASLFPSFSVTGSSGSNRARATSDSSWQDTDFSRVSLGASYEIDLWGRISADRAAAQASYESSQYDFAAAQLSLAGGVASAWFQWLALQQQIATTNENIDISQRVYKVVDARYRNGVASAADLARQRTSLLTQQATLLPLQLQARQTRAALALLVGRVPQGFSLPEEKLMNVQLPQIAAGVPSDIIVRRPDLASAEAQLAVGDADVKAARAALLPSFTLGASAGTTAAELFSLSGGADSLGWSLSLAQTLFDGGRLRNQVKVNESSRIALLENYRKAIYTALQEADDALDRTHVNALQEQSQREIVAQAQRTLTLTEVRYREGSDDLLTLLDAQRSLFLEQDQLAKQRLARLNAAIDLYKALGGGWQQQADFYPSQF